MNELPQDFVSFTKNLFKDEYEDFISSLQEEVPVSIRINPDKILSSPPYSTIPWTKNGYYLPERPPFTFDPLFHAGTYYVQEASSMFPEQVFSTYIHEPVRMLDLCAAPGGKSSHALSLLPEGSLLVSNEVIRSRAQILTENLAKWGKENVIITNNDASHFNKLPGFFDVILVDAPCSGEGMFRKDPEAVRQWSPENVQLCAERQQRILADIWVSLKPGGLLIYSTCTYNTVENEENIKWLTSSFDAETLPVPTEKEWQVSTPFHPHCYRFFPHKTKGEGFALTVIRKTETEEKGKSLFLKKGKQLFKAPEQSKKSIQNPERFVFDELNQHIIAIPSDAYEAYQLLKKYLRIVEAGLSPGEIKGKDFIPSPALAFSINLNREAFPSVEIDWSTAIRYLKKEAIVLPPETPRGHVLLAYQHIPVGFVKNIGNRANNLYPQEWRIRSQYIPKEKVKIGR
ncbi:MAG: rRNA cytosine-C5-methyltransferase [Candidatus Azobacteroides sp.]|nr:rRNA cytosine-C5-methyltransferase [Candidatus Azobacteroides sp.]